MNNYYKEYDETDKYSIEKYGQKMVGKTFQNLIDDDSTNARISETEFVYGKNKENKNDKGELGKIIEERFFHYKVNSNSEPDFKEAGVELKATPYKINKNKTFSAKERLSLGDINYFEVINESNFYNSHFWYKNQLILLVYYLWKAEQKRLNYRIDFVKLFTPSEEDLKIIKEDYKKIIKKIQDGKAHELSESDTMYLSACTKGANSSVTKIQPNSNIPAKTRAFAYKNSYMTYVLNNYIIGKKPLYESISKDKDIDNFESYVISRIEQYKGKSFNQLKDIFNIDRSKNPKNLGSMLALRMLDVKGKNAEEFEKANIVVKTIKVNKNGSIKESMSFPAFKFKELIKEKWEESYMYELLSSTKFLFVVYQETEDGEYVLDHAQFWNMPYEDLNKQVKSAWENTKKIINDGVIITKKGKYHHNNLPGSADNPVCHVRPHSKETYYKYGDYEIGEKKYGDILPDGRWMTKQCFWLNNTYIKSVIENTPEF